MGRWIPTGSSSLDRALNGGLPPGWIILIYGEAETGKTTLAMQCAVNSARIGYKTLFIDSDGTFSPERLSQIASEDFERVSESIIFAKPSTFSEQVAIVDDLEKYVGRRFGLVVLDTITSLYRSDLRDKRETFKLNRELNRQVATLAQIAKSLEVSVLLVSQVRTVVKSGEADIAPVATRVLKFWSDAVIRLSRTGRRNIVEAAVEKSGGKKTRLTFYLAIQEEGIRDHSR